jgi:hypothetical protein
MKKLMIAGTIAGTMILSSFAASAAVVSAGGIQWDDITTHPGGIAMQSNFTQWFANVGVNGASTITTDAAVVGAMGKELVGLGEFYSFADGREPVGPPSFCVSGSCELTYAFGGLVVNPDGATFSTASSWLNIYIDEDPDFDGVGDSNTALASTSHGKYAEAQNGTLWAAYTFETFSLAGTLLGGSTEFTLSLVGGHADVMAKLDYNNMPFGDLANTATARFNDSLYSHDGNGQHASFKVPEPTSLAIFGLGLLGLAGAARRKQA